MLARARTLQSEIRVRSILISPNRGMGTLCRQLRPVNDTLESRNDRCTHQPSSPTAAIGLSPSLKLNLRNMVQPDSDDASEPSADPPSDDPPSAAPPSAEPSSEEPSEGAALPRRPSSPLMFSSPPALRSPSASAAPVSVPVLLVSVDEGL